MYWVLKHAGLLVAVGRHTCVGQHVGTLLVNFNGICSQRGVQPTVPTKSTFPTCQVTTTNTHVHSHTSTQHDTTAQFLFLTTHTQSYMAHKQDMFNLSLNSNSIGVLDKFEKSMGQQNNVLHESLRQSFTASKEHYLCNAKPCDGKTALDLSTWLEDVSRISIISCKDLESVTLATSSRSFHKYVRAVFIR